MTAVVALAIGVQVAAVPAKHTSGPVPIRKVVLLDFGRHAEAEGPPVGIEPQQIADVAGQMERAFTNAEPHLDPGIVPAFGQMPTSLDNLPNPFVLHAVSSYPSMSAATFGGGSCLVPAYQPDFSHGRLVEARRRIIFPLVHQIACEHGIPVGLFDALVMQESRYNPAIVSPKGAFGLSQLMPATARTLGADRYSLVENLRGGARYLRQQIDRFGRYDLALAAYNSGPGRVARLGRIPAIAETTDYVRKISASWSPGFVAPAQVAPIAMMRRPQLIFMPYVQRTRG